MVVLDKPYQEELMETSPNDHADAPPSYETITTVRGGPSNGGYAQLVGEKSPRRSDFPPTPRSASSSIQGESRASTSRPLSQSNPPLSSWLSMRSFTASRTSKQVRQTVLALLRDLVLNVESPDLLHSCADACRAHSLDLSALLQEQYIEQHSAVYWAVLNRSDTLLPSLLAHAAPLSQATIAEIRLACLASSNQHLFQSLRCQREPFTKQMTVLSTNPGTDALVLGTIPADEVSIHEKEGQAAFVAEMRINLWQKRMRVSGRVSVEFIARGRMWSLTFFSPSAARVGMWQLALCLLEHSPPTFIDSRLVVDMPPASPNVQSSDLISLSSPPNEASSPSPSPSPSSKSKSKSKAQRVEVRLKSTNRLAYRGPNTFLAALDGAFSSQKDWDPPHAEQWSDNGTLFTNAIIVPLDGPGGELLYSHSPFIASDGTLHAHLEAQLGEKPGSTDCVIC